MKKKSIPILFLLVLLSSTVLVWRASATSGFLAVRFFDVGQGDAIFIETPYGHQVLIDGGPDAAVLEKLGRTMPFWDRTIDVVVLTHPDADHLAGLLDVLERYEVSIIVESGLRKETLLSQAWEDALEQEGAERILVARPIRLQLGEGTFLDFLWPLEKKDGEVMERPNDFAVIARLIYGHTTFLFPADIERWTEQELLSRNIDLDSDILKVPHHGSKTSTSEAFLEAVSPDIAVISVGENRYGHPAREALERLEQRGVEILRTDDMGDIIFRSDGKELFRK